MADHTGDFTELLNQLAGKLDEDLLEDTEMVALLSQLVTILDNDPEALPPEMIEQLEQIKDKRERFQAAAEQTGAMDPNALNELAEQMKASGLLSKKEDDGD